MRLGCGIATASVAAAFLVPGDRRWPPGSPAPSGGSRNREPGSTSPTISRWKSGCRRCGARSTSPTRWVTRPVPGRACATTTSPRTPCGWPAGSTPCVPTTARPPGCSRWCCSPRRVPPPASAPTAPRFSSPTPIAGAGIATSSPRAWPWSPTIRRAAARGPGRDRRRARPGADAGRHRLEADRRPVRHAAGDRTEPDDRRRTVCRAVLPARRGGWVGRPRRGARARWAPRALPVRPRRPGADARPPRACARRRRTRGLGRRRAPAPTAERDVLRRPGRRCRRGSDR